MNISIEIHDGCINNVDLSNPCKGNPGIGGTEYELSLLAHQYQTTYPEDHITIFHSSSSVICPAGVEAIIVSSVEDMIDKMIERKIDIYVSNLSGDSVELSRKLLRTNINLVLWAALVPNAEVIQYARNARNIKRIAFVEHEEYCLYLDDDIIKKSCILPNMIYVGDMYPDEKRDQELKHTVTYLGSLLPQKGFHVLARQWKNVLKEVPDATLNVIGSAQVYDRNTSLGQYGLSIPEYEEKFIPYLVDDQGQILPSVRFHGMMGEEKKEILKKTMVGIVNPTAYTETFCISAVEMQEYGIPMVTVGKNSYFDVIDKNRSGLLFRTEKQFSKYIIKMLKDRKLNDRMGIYAKEYVKKYATSVNIPKWKMEFANILEGKPSRYIGTGYHIFQNRKITKLINRFLRMYLGLSKRPSLTGGKWVE